MTDFEHISTRFHEHLWKSDSLSFNESLSNIQWSPNGNFTLVGDLGGNIHVLDGQSTSPSIVDTFSPSSSRVTSVSINQTSDVIASTSVDDHHVVLAHCHPDTGKINIKTVELKCPSRPMCVSFMQDGRTGQSLLLIGDRQGVRIIDVESGALFRQLYNKTGSTTIQSWNGCMFAGGTLEGNVALWDARSQETIAVIGDKNHGKRCIYSFDASARLLCIAGKSGSAHFYDVTSKKRIMTKQIMENDIRSLSFSSNYRYLVASDANKLNLINLNEIVVNSFSLPSKSIDDIQTVTGVRWHPVECRFVAMATDKKIRSFTPYFEDS